MVKVAIEKLPGADKKLLQDEIARVEKRTGISVRDYLKYFNDGPQPTVQYSDNGDTRCIGELG